MAKSQVDCLSLPTTAIKKHDVCGLAVGTPNNVSPIQEAYTLVTSSRSAVVTDKLYTCEQVYHAM